MVYQWYPGHMTKTIRQMEEDIRLIDLVIELLDARIPAASRNPEFDTIARGKARMIVLNKTDLADEAMTKQWVRHYEDQGLVTVALDARKNRSVRSLVLPQIDVACADKIEKNKQRGILNRPMRCMIVGVPNTGKSTFINSLSGRASAKTGNRPGVTRGKQWIHLNKQCDLLDTPGVLMPKIESRQTGECLALTGAIKDDLLDPTELSGVLIEILNERFDRAIPDRYGIPGDGSTESVLHEIALRRGLLAQKGEPDPEKAAKLLIREFRDGTLGRITLEEP